jgi:hypothetical protein
LTTEELGLLYKLPYFYQEDCALEQVVATTVSAEFQLPHLSQLTDYTLTPVVEILKSRKGGESVEFVYRNQHNHAFENQIGICRHCYVFDFFIVHTEY